MYTPNKLVISQIIRSDKVRSHLLINRSLVCIVNAFAKGAAS